MKILITILVLSLSAVAFSQTIDQYGVYHAVEEQTLAAEEQVTFGPFFVGNRKAEINAFVYGITSSGDSLKVDLDIYGMMTNNIADTLKADLIASTGVTSLADSTVALADTLVDTENFPILYGKLLNADTNNTVTVDVFIHIRPSDRALIRLR
jgi:hypothetical protein